MVTFPFARILVIDDNPAVVDIMATHLRGAGYGVSSALTGDEGLKDFTLARPDLVLLDITLQGEMNGIELLKRIRSIDPASKVIMVTGNDDPVLAREALELGAIAYIDKPFDFAYLKRVVALALRPETTSG
jgi:two-component system OmpR family response regulator